MLPRCRMGNLGLPPGLLHIPARILSLPAARALLVCSLLWLLGFTYGRLFLWRDPHSAYFRSESVYDLDYSAARQQQARDYIARVTHDDTTTDTKPPPKAGATPALCAAFVTVRRDGPGDAPQLYLRDAVGSMLAGLDPRERAALSLHLLFADTDPAARQHPDWGAAWVRLLADSAASYENLTDLQLAGLRKAEEERDLQLKGVFDYLYVLRRCLEETAAPFVAVFEDDVVFAGDWMARTMKGVEYLARNYYKPPAEGEKDWLYLRLFYTETYFGFASEGDWWYRHLPLTLAMAAGATAMSLILLRALPYCRERLRLDWLTIAVLSLVVAPGFTALAFMAGKHNLPLPGYSLHHSVAFGPPTAALAAGVVPMEHHGCCSQALVFNRRALPDLMRYLSRRERGQTDSMIEDYCDATGAKRFALREQAVQHVGMVSSRGAKAADTRSIWAFWFEANKPDVVERSHHKVVEEVDWALFDRLASGR